MKLRNKKTGGLANMLVEQGFIRVYTDAGWEDFGTLAGLNEYWEDYKPAEPLIRDEKIRTAVRAWAEANDLEVVSYYKSSHYWYLRSFNDHEQGIDFWLSYNAEPEMIENKYYTITELCGEEE